MAKKLPRAVTVHMTQRSLRDIKGIEAYSLEQFGRRVANQYLDKLEAGISRLAENPELLREEPPFHASLRFYRIEKHVVACETAVKDRLIILAILHASMDIPMRLAELEPTLKLEVELLSAKLRK